MSDEAAGTEFDEDLSTAGTTSTSRSRAPRGGRKVTQVTKREFIEREAEDDLKAHLPGLFALSDIEENSIVRIRVYRRDPDEGMVGYLDDPNATEDEILQRWGGSQYRVEGLNQSGRVVAARALRIAGEPIFVGPTARLNWERRNGIPSTVHQPTQPGMSPAEMLAFMRQMDEERRKAEDARIQREAAERREHEERMRKLELEAEDRRRKDELEREERKRREEAERDEKRRRDDAEREERRKREAEEDRRRSQEHTQQLLTMMKTSNEQALMLLRQQTPQDQGKSMMDAVKMIATIKDAFSGDSAGPEDTDPVNLLIKHGHEWLTGLGSAVTGAIREVKGGGAAPAAGPAAAPQLAPTSDGGLTIPANSPIAGKLQTLVGQLVARGRDPEVVLSGVLDNLNATLQAQPAPAGAAPGAPAATGAFRPTPEAVAQAASTAPVTPAAAPAAPAPSPAKTQVQQERTTRGSTRISFSTT